MISRPTARPGALRPALAILTFLVLFPAPALAQAQTPPGVQFHVRGTTQQLELIVKTSRILTMDKKIPRIQVSDPEIIKATPLTPNQVQVAALKSGLAQVNLWDENEQIYTIDIIVLGDARELQMLLSSEFPNSSLRVRPLASSAVVSGYVDRPETVSRVIQIAEDYYPKIISNITVGGVPTVLLHVKVLEVSRTKLRAMGFEWSNLNSDDFVMTLGMGGDMTAPTAISFGIVDGSNNFTGFLEALRQYNLVKVLANPTLVTVSGRPASFNVGGEFPIIVPEGLGTVAIEFKEFGTRVDFVPIVLGNGNLRLEVRPLVSELDPTRSVTVNDIKVPGLRTRWVDTAVEMKAGQTLALAGLVQERVESENKGIPWLADLPWAGPVFRRVEDKVNEIELLVLVTPELVVGMDPHEVPQCLPGSHATNPNDVELYFRGYTEVPKCCPEGNGHSARRWDLVPGTVMPQFQDLPADASVGTSFGGEPARRRQEAPRRTAATAGPGSGNTLLDRQHRRAATPPAPSTDPAFGAAPAASRRPYSNLQMPNSVKRGGDARSSEAARSDTGLIGPIGYDILDYP